MGALTFKNEQLTFWLKCIIVTSFFKYCFPVYSKEKFPNPFIDSVVCGGNQHSRSFLCDPDGFLKASQRESINSIILLIENSTKCICKNCLEKQHGFKVGVAITDAIPKPSGPAHVKYGDYLRKAWRLGKCDDDILVLFVTGEKKIYVSRGVYLSKILTGDVLRDIYDKQGSDLYTYKGLKNVLLAIHSSLVVSQDPTLQNLPYIIGGAVGGFVLLILIVFCIVNTCVSKRKQKQRRRNHEMGLKNKNRSEEMNKRIADFENQGVKYPDYGYNKARIDEPDASSRV